MTSIKSSCLALALLLPATAALAVDSGVQRAADGTVEAVTAPAKIVEGVQAENRKNGPVAGAVVGTAKGTLNAAGAVIEGGAGIAVGTLEATVGVVKRVVQPLGGQ
jgi:hypothetical protein